MGSSEKSCHLEEVGLSFLTMWERLGCTISAAPCLMFLGAPATWHMIGFKGLFRGYKEEAMRIYPLLRFCMYITKLSIIRYVNKYIKLNCGIGNSLERNGVLW